MARHECVVRLYDDGEQVSVYVANLPGAMTCGKDDEEALSMARDAIECLLQVYKENGMPVPWREPKPIRAGDREHVIQVDTHG